MSTLIGYLRPWGDGYVVIGTCCATDSQREMLTPIFEVNILPYRQPCCECGRELVAANGNFPVLFDGSGVKKSEGKP
jgi:hypothetical protein